MACRRGRRFTAVGAYRAGVGGEGAQAGVGEGTGGAGVHSEGVMGDVKGVPEWLVYLFPGEPSKWVLYAPQVECGSLDWERPEVVFMAIVSAHKFMVGQGWRLSSPSKD